MSRTIYRLELSLSWYQPEIWRHLEMPADMSLRDLHEVIQATTGWSNSGTYGFSHEYKEYGPRNREFDRPELSDRHTRIEDLLTNQGDRLVYYYGPNGWQYDVILDAIKTVPNDVARPGVTAGEGAFPLENMDRSVHYTELLGLIASLEKVDGGGMKTLDGSPWDPTVVDIQAEDDRLQQFWRRWCDKSSRPKHSAPVARLVSLGGTQWGKAPWDDYLALGLTPEHVPELLQLVAADIAPPSSGGQVEGTWEAVHAWRALGQIASVDAVVPLLEMFNEDLGDAWMEAEVPRAIGMIGAPAIPAVTSFLHDADRYLGTRMATVDALEAIAMAEPDMYTKVVAALSLELSNYSRNDPALNSCIVGTLVYLRATETAPVIGQAFRDDAVDLTFDGDWEDVLIQLGMINKRWSPRREQ